MEDHPKDRPPDTLPVPDLPELPEVPDPATAPTQVTPALGPSLPPGTLIGGRYQVLGILGVGGMGVVYRVHDNVLDLDLALKMLLPEMARDESFLKRFRNELIVARQVTHRHVVRNHDLGSHGDSYFMTMDLVEGRSLRQVLKQEGKLHPNRAVELVRQIASALGEAHRRGIVHRDLKPANILIDAAGDAYITDFGIARSLSGAGLTRTGEVLGTPDYLSPEQARGEQVDGRSDLYTLGIMFIEMLSGKLPFPGGTLLEILSQRMQGKVARLSDLGVEVSPNLTRIIERCVESNPQDRYASAEDLIADLDHPERLLGPEGRPGPSPASTRAVRREPLPGLRTGGWAALVLVALGLGGMAVLRWAFPPKAEESTAETATSGSAPTADVSDLGEPTVSEPRYSVAVLPLPEASGRPELAWASKGVAEMLATALAESESLRVVDSVRVFQILQDLGLEPDRMRSDELTQLADLFQVDRLVFGRLRSVEDQVQLDLELIDAAQPQSPRHVGSQAGPVEGLFEMVATLGVGLRNELDVPALSEPQRPPTFSATAMQAYTEGLEYLSQRETLKAAPALERAVAQDPQFTHAWVRLSQAYQGLGQFDEALEAARRGVESAANGAGRVVYEARAQEALLQGETAQAQGFLEQLVERYPNDSAAHIVLAEAYGQQGKFADAVASLKRAVQVDPSEPRAWYLLGRFAIQSGDSRRAVDEYLLRALVQQKTLQNEQGQGEVHNAFGVGYVRLGLMDEAAESYQKAAEIRNRVGDRRGLAVTLHNLGVIHIQRGEHDLAEENLATALEIHTELGNRAGIGKLTNAYGTLEEERGRYAEALDYYSRSLQVRTELGDDRALAESHVNVGYVYYLLGEYGNALLYLEKGQTLFEQNDDPYGKILVLSTRGLCQLERGDWSEALGSFLEGLNLSRQSDFADAAAISQGGLGRVAHYQGRYGAALSSYGEALAVLAELGDQRNQVEVTLWETETLLNLGALDEAEERLEQLARWQPDSPGQRFSLQALRGKWHLERREAGRAATIFSQALAGDTVPSGTADQIRAQIGSGRSALMAGEKKRAVSELTRALAEGGRLGNALLELQAGEALATAALAAGELPAAEEALRRALRVVEKSGSYGRSFYLHYLLSRVLNQRGLDEEARKEWRTAQAEMARVRDNLNDDLRRTFDHLAEVAELLTAAPLSEAGDAD